MKKTAGFLFLLLLALPLISCANPNNNQPLSFQSTLDISSAASNKILLKYNDTETSPMKFLLDSYYKGQNSRAFKMIQKRIFQNNLESWISVQIDDIDNPVWNYDSFTKYHIVNQDMISVALDEDLYYCTFSADHNKSGYIVVSYDGESLSKVEAVETPYLYDLNANLEDITDALRETGLDLSSASASRVQLTDEDGNRTDEAIHITDGNGSGYLYCFGESSISVTESAVSP